MGSKQGKRLRGAAAVRLNAVATATNEASIGLMTKLGEVGMEDLGEQGGLVNSRNPFEDLMAQFEGSAPAPKRVHTFKITRTGFRRYTPSASGAQNH